MQVFPSGTRFTIKIDGDILTYTVEDGAKPDIPNGIISSDSPIGKTLLEGRRIFKLPAGHKVELLQVNGEWITDGVVAKFLEEATVKRNRQKDRKRKDLQQLNRQKELKIKRLQELNRQKKRERKLHELNRQKYLERKDMFLKKLDEGVEGDYFSQSDIYWLKEEAEFPILAGIYQRKGLLAKAGRYWRYAGQPSRALKITDNDSTAPPVLTMRGAAYADLGQFADAEKSARQSLIFDPKSAHTYNLLGRIYLQTDRPEAGHQHFNTAIKMGSSQKSADATIMKSLAKAEKQAQRKGAKYFYDKNPKRYRALKKYLK